MPFLKSNKIHSIYVDEHKTVISTAGVKTAVYIHYNFLGITKGLIDIVDCPAFLTQIQTARKVDSTKAEISAPSRAYSDTCICIIYLFLFYFYCYVYVFLLLCMFCSVYSVFIVPTGTLRLP